VFAFEEDGLIGSSQHVQALSDAERARIVAMIDLDMIGYQDQRPGSQRYPAGFDRLLEQPLPDTGDFIAAIGIADQAILPAMQHAQAYVPGLRAGAVPLRRWQTLAAPDTMRGDHAPFWAAGIPAALVSDTGEYRNPGYHQPSDGLGSVDVGFATLVTQWVAASALTLAGAP
jgi:Zn-dependent M28 family amino/carboxypeptidase